MRSHNPEIDPTDELPTVGPACREVEELLAWHGNGCLSSSEGRIVDDHLAGCAKCRVSLQETLDVGKMLSQHLPVEVLIGHALGEPTPELATDLVADHLQHCATCREELELIAADLVEETASVADFEQARSAREVSARSNDSVARRSRGLRGLEWLAAAACLALAVVWAVPDRGEVDSPVQANQPADPASEASSDAVAIISVLEFDVQGPVAVLPSGRAVLDGVFVNGFESAESRRWTYVINGEERQLPTDSTVKDETEPILSTNEET